MSRAARSPFPYRLWMFGAPVWGAAMALSALAGLYLRFRLETAHLTELILLYFAGGMAGWLAALPLARLVAACGKRERRFAAMMLALTGMTVLFTAGFFALDYRSFYAQWHAPFGTRIWVYQFVFTSASAFYQFLVLGLRLYLPLGIGFILAASLYLSRQMR